MLVDHLITLLRRLSMDTMKKIQPSAFVAGRKMPSLCGYCSTVSWTRSSKMRQGKRKAMKKRYFKQSG